jgi:glyoxylase-like metal-dependent hydrolase (beta-lactamase superfamily II)
MIIRKVSWLVALVVATTLSGCAGGQPAPSGAAPSGAASSGVAPGSPTPAAPVGSFSSDNPGSVNIYWLSAPDGLVLVDGLRTLSDARRALTGIQATGRPVAAILLTHPHPDHVGGLTELHRAYPEAPIYANTATAEFIRTDPLGFYALTHQQLGDDHPAKPVVPDHTVGAGAPLDVAGLHLETAEFGAGESVTAVAYYQPDTGALFPGDLVGNRVTPALLEGHTCGWLTGLDQLRARFPAAKTLYPGHGAPGDPATLIDAQREYVRTFRAFTRPTAAESSPGGPEVTADERRGVVTELDRRYPNYPRVASLPNIQELNIAAVAKELAGETTADTVPPPACRP